MHLLLGILGSIVIACNGMANEADAKAGINSRFLPTYGATAINVDKFRNIMTTGDSKLGIPVLDPFEVEQYPFELTEEKLLDIRGLLRNSKVDGLANFTAIQANFNVIGVKVNLHLFWDSIKLFTDYSVKGTIADALSIYGLGEIDADVRGLDVNVNLSLSIKEGKLYVRTFKSEIKLKELGLKMTGLFYDEEISKIFSSIIADVMPQLIVDYQVELTTKVNTLVTNFVNDFVKDKSLKDLLALLG